MSASIGIVTFTQQSGIEDAGSTRIRALWPLKHWPEAEVFQLDRAYRAIIFQKAYWLEYAQRFSGLKILDICDPDFVGDGPRCRRMMDLCDAVTCASPAIAEYAASVTCTPIWVIPDRLDLDTIRPHVRQHAGPTRTAVWFGYSLNFPMLDTIVDALPRCGVTRLLAVASAGMPYQLPPTLEARLELTNLVWSEDTVYRDLLRADVVLNPRSTEGKWRFKSLNKTTLAWALGLPVAHNEAELMALTTEEARRTEGARRRAEVLATCDVRTSVEDYRRVIAHLSGEESR